MNTSISPDSKPAVSLVGPIGAFMVELLIWNGSPFKDHWAYFVRSDADPDIGVKIHATGNVRSGFEFEIKRSENLRTTDDIPSTRVPLQWVDASYFDEKAMLNDGEYKIDIRLSVASRGVLTRSKLQGKSKPGRKVIQRDCQTWIVESADQLHRDNILSNGVAAYLHAIKQ
ncbi:hypothetical protein N7516_000930 [Penicillium verrucosum]|uniref:uncharacterized protein n=1 Tax=Penicillium verrucosum TaxID=60171 RepID=UPI002545A23A|nr:uncharacterized protein N7516_000930 [Penicillium verrucosum]KAJ5940762.1 hypothetical protein N7516_000930 [Penicillium verrucosum]